MLPNSVSQFMMSKKGRFLSMGLSGLLILLILLIIYQNYHALTMEEPNAQTQIGNNTQKKTNHYPSLLKTELFGQYLPESVDGDNVKKSLLNLKLVGVMQAFPAKYSQVIITTSSGRDKILMVGDEIESGITVVKIYQDKVLIAHDGQVESISMQKHSLQFEPPAKTITMEQN